MEMMDFFEGRMGRLEVDYVANCILADNKQFGVIYSMTELPDEKIAWRALWVFEHVCKKGGGALLLPYRMELVDRAINCAHSGMKRILLNILLLLPEEGVLRVDFLDACLAWMQSEEEPVAARAVAMKLAYRMVERCPDFGSEYRSLLEMMRMEACQPALSSTVRRILSSMDRRRR